MKEAIYTGVRMLEGCETRNPAIRCADNSIVTP